jgi:hypothetical protein
MSSHWITVRGFRLRVEAKRAEQLERTRLAFETLTNRQLEALAREDARERVSCSE